MMGTIKQTKSGNTLFWNNLFSSFYLFVFLSYLYLSNEYLQMGSWSNIHFILLLAVAEVLKFIFYIKNEKTHIHKPSKDILQTIFSIILLFGIFYTVTVLLGAALLSKIEETLMFTLLLTVLTALPICLYHGGSAAISMFLSITSMEKNDINNLFLVNVRLTLLGAWMGALVIPLDWNRQWQKWPITCCLGTIIGCTLGNWICVILQYKKNKARRKTGKYTL